jgi:hypothetical protein
LRDIKRRAMLALNDQERAMPRIRQPDTLSPFIPGTPARRPPPPAQLDVREKRTWTQITKSLPPDWFLASWPVLMELCRHIRLSEDLRRDIACARTAIDEFRRMPEPPLKLLLEASKQYRAWLRLHAQQTQRIGALATKLRLTPQSRYEKSVAATAARMTDEEIPPWRDWENDGPESEPDSVESGEQNGRNRKQ